MQNSDSLEVFIESKADGVFIIGHSSALVRMNDKLVALDPVWNHVPYGKYWKFVPEQVNCDSVLDKLDACIVSHIHEDHLCDRILSQIRPYVTVMGGRPDLVERIRRSRPVMEIVGWEWWPLVRTQKGWIEILFVPNENNAIDSSCFIRGNDFCVYHGNDNFLTVEQLNRLKPIVGDVDVALVPYQFISWYPVLMRDMSAERKMSEIARLNALHLQHSDDFQRIIQPKVLVPFGGSIFYNDGAEHALNSSLTSPHDVNLGVSMFSGDMVLDGRVIRTINALDPYRSNEMGLAVGKGYGKPIRPYKWTEYHTGVLESKLRNAERKYWNVVINGISIDATNKTVGDRVTEPYMWFEFEEEEFKAWISGQMTFEQVIGTRRFICGRNPDEHMPAIMKWANKYL